MKNARRNLKNRTASGYWHSSRHGWTRVRNPLQAIAGDLYLAQSELATIPDKEEKKSLEESLAEIDKNTQYINKIVADLQDFAKPLMPKIEETDVEQVVNSALTTLEIPENIATVHYIGKGFPKVKADPTYLKRIIVNLSNNAMQDMPKGGNLP